VDESAREAGVVDQDAHFDVAGSGSPKGQFFSRKPSTESVKIVVSTPLSAMALWSGAKMSFPWSKAWPPIGRTIDQREFRLVGAEADHHRVCHDFPLCLGGSDCDRCVSTVS